MRVSRRSPCRLLCAALCCWCLPAALCSAADISQVVNVPLSEWLTLKTNLKMLDESSPTVVSSSESLVSETEQQRQELQRQSTLAMQYRTELTELRPELLSLRTLLPQVRSELTASEASLAALQTNYASAQASLAKAEQSLTAIRNETTAALWTGIALGIGAGLVVAGVVYLVVAAAGS